LNITSGSAGDVVNVILRIAEEASSAMIAGCRAIRGNQ